MGPVDGLADAFGRAQQAVFESAVQPVLLALGAEHLLEDGFAAAGWLVAGLLQLALLLTLVRAVERRWPLEPVTDRRAVRTDIVFTLLHKLGAFRVALFLLLGDALLRVKGAAGAAHIGWEVDALWPGVTDRPWVAFAVYLVLFDLVDYAIHRAQHAIGVWWALHAVHHSQRQMTMWSDQRNHLLDDVVRDVLVALAAIVVGVPPGQFIAVVVVARAVENLAHANTRLAFPRWLERLIVSPRFHRVHHAIGLGHEARSDGHGATASRVGSLGGRNFGVLFPWWDMLFGSADFTTPVQPTGIRDQLEGRDYGRGFWALQWRALPRLWQAVRGRG